MNKERIIQMIKEVVAYYYGERIPTATLFIHETDNSAIRVDSVLSNGIKLADNEVYEWNLLSVDELQYILKNIL